MVKNYYNRIRGETQAMKKEEELAKALSSLRRRTGRKTRVRSPLHPKSEEKARTNRILKILNANLHTNNDPYSHLTQEERANLNKARGVGGRRTRRHRATRRK